VILIFFIDLSVGEQSGCCIVVPELPTLNHVWGISKLFFPYYNIIWSLGVAFLQLSMIWPVVVFLAFMTSKMEKDGTT
jgi:hypothetical protein